MAYSEGSRNWLSLNAADNNKQGQSENNMPHHPTIYWQQLWASENNKLLYPT